MFSVVFSNRFENLLDALLTQMDIGSPFAHAQIVVPSSAIKRRVELAAADRFGIAAGMQFDYLAHWLWQRIGHLVPVPDRSPYAPSVLAWRVLATLEGNWTRAHGRLFRYLEKADARQRFEFAGRLAHLYDHYLCYRPVWLEKWAVGERVFAGQADELWQAELWQRMHGEVKLPFLEFLRRVTSLNEAALGEPGSVDVFCLSTLPPLYLEVLRTLARRVDVRLYVLNPCREYWFDIVDARYLSWLAPQRDLFHETGNRLLASWGKQVQAQIESLFEGEHSVLEHAVFTPHPGTHLLACLQNAILNLEELGHVKLEDSDRSIELHRCHSRLRELEVLHDRLLSLFRDHRDLRPDEIVVLTPDLATCAPLIEAVFGTAPRDRFIAWHITGLGTEENPVARVLDDLLALVSGSMPASSVFELLRQPLVMARFGLNEASLEQVRDWMIASNIRWGLDAEQAHESGSMGGHTVESGLARLFLSWSVGDVAGQSLFAGQTGIPLAPQGSSALTLGAFWHYARTLQRLRARLLSTHDASGWRALLLDALTALVGEAGAEDMRAVRDVINALADDMTGSEPSLEVVRAALLERLTDDMRGGVPGGSVTFSAMSSLRNLPYRVVCVIGLDREAFPPRNRGEEFDLMAAFPQKSDRQRKDDARNLFLDIVLSAREYLHLSCIGRSARDNAELPPSVLVDELLDALALACATHPEQSACVDLARARLMVDHPLQSFSTTYFQAGNNQGGRLENFRSEFARALNERARRRQQGGHEFFTSLLPPPSEEWRSVDLTQLKRFFDNPCSYLLRERLGLDLSGQEEDLTDAEALIPDWPARQAMTDRLLPALLSASEPLSADELLALARAGGEYPAGDLGEKALQRELAALGEFAARVTSARRSPLLPVHTAKLLFPIEGETWELRISFGALRTDGHLVCHYDDVRARAILATWIDHLALCAAPPEMECYTCALSRQGKFTLRPLPVAEARAHLEALLVLYREGLREPLRFFPKSAWEYVRSRGDEAHAFDAASRKWNDGDFPEKHQFAYRLALRGTDGILDARFRENARTVFGPIWSVQEGLD